MSLHTVVIDRKLKPKKTKFSSIQSKTSVKEYWLNNIKQEDNQLFRQSTEKYESLYTIVNGPHTNLSSNAILESFLWAYYRHHDIVLSPDDMWLLVCMFFAQHVNENAEQLRSNFVEHNKGAMTLTTNNFDDKYDWNEFYDQMKKEIVKNTKNNICQLLTADFSTTGKVESILSTACIMNTFKFYFEYQREICICGIRQVHFMGTLNDWQSLRIKTEQLKLFTDEKFHGYLIGVLSIFDQFIETYKEQISQEDNIPNNLNPDDSRQSETNFCRSFSDILISIQCEADSHNEEVGSEEPHSDQYLSTTCYPPSVPEVHTSPNANSINKDVDDKNQRSIGELILIDPLGKDYPNNSKNFYGINTWSLARVCLNNSNESLPKYYIRNQSRATMSMSDEQEHQIALDDLTKMCGGTDNEQQYWFHATSWNNAQNIIETGPQMGDKPSDYSSHGAFYLNPCYYDCYDWFITRNSVFKGHHAMIIYKFNPEELSKKEETPDKKQWKKNVKELKESSFKNDFDWSRVRQDKNPGNFSKKHQIAARPTTQGKLAMQLVIHTASMCEKIHLYLAGCIFYQNIPSKRSQYEYQYTAQDFLKKPSTVLSSSQSNTLLNNQQHQKQQKKNDLNENNLKNKFRPHKSKKKSSNEG
ncbi:unnamed protein product [Adineta steineri]|uniref:Uncharacterized protein n=1 Tax=Adineta steineri TaxID=433720 RepID=A0A815ZDI2_9BILA|nr:unnamed protein product [Adineta steineri]CAF1582133.1 unnamed protein product [Adineta steineri]